VLSSSSAATLVTRCLSASSSPSAAGCTRETPPSSPCRQLFKGWVRQGSRRPGGGAAGGVGGGQECRMPTRLYVHTSTLMTGTLKVPCVKWYSRLQCILVSFLHKDMKLQQSLLRLDISRAG